MFRSNLIRGQYERVLSDHRGENQDVVSLPVTQSLALISQSAARSPEIERADSLVFACK